MTPLIKFFADLILQVPGERITVVIQFNTEQERFAFLHDKQAQEDLRDEYLPESGYIDIVLYN